MPYPNFSLDNPLLWHGTSSTSDCTEQRLFKCCHLCGASANPFSSPITFGDHLIVLPDVGLNWTVPAPQFAHLSSLLFVALQAFGNGSPYVFSVLCCSPLQKPADPLELPLQGKLYCGTGAVCNGHTQLHGMNSHMTDRRCDHFHAQLHWAAC